MRLIDAKQLEKQVKEAFETQNPVLMGQMLRWIRKQKTIDAVPVVRCKYCIRRYDTDECPMCFLIEGKYYEYTNGNGFCDRGERKEGAE